MNIYLYIHLLMYLLWVFKECHEQSKTDIYSMIKKLYQIKKLILAQFFNEKTT